MQYDFTDFFYLHLRNSAFNHLRLQFRHVSDSPMLVGRRLRWGVVHLGARYVLQNDSRGLFHVLFHVAVQVLYNDVGLREKYRSLRGVLADDGHRTPQSLGVPFVSYRFVSVRYTAHQRTEAVHTVHERFGYGNFDIFCVYVPGKHGHVHDRNGFHNQVSHAGKQIFQNQPGPGTPWTGNRAHVDEHHRKDGCCRTPSRLRWRLLRVQRPLDRKCGRNNAYQTPVDPRRCLRVDQFVRHAHGLVVTYSVRNDATRHLLPSFRRYGCRFEAVDIYLHVVTAIHHQILYYSSISSQHD